MAGGAEHGAITPEGEGQIGQLGLARQQTGVGVTGQAAAGRDHRDPQLTQLGGAAPDLALGSLTAGACDQPDPLQAHDRTFTSAAG